MSRQIKLNINTDIVIENQYYVNEIRNINEGEIKKKFQIITYGCQMNEHDSEKLMSMLINMGFEETTTTEEADIIIFNTCAVRENAELKVYGNLGRIKHLKETKKDMIVAVCGCMMQQKHIIEEIKKKYKFVNIVFGTHNIHNFPKLLRDTLYNRKQIIEIWNSEVEIVEGLPYKRKLGIKAFVNIMFGCNNFCTYCIVPYTRGRERSRDSENIIREIEELVIDGVKEITLLGQNVNSYGKTLDYKYDFADLLIDVSKIDGLLRIRFMTSHPKDISDKLIEVIATNPKVSNYVHLPIQSGSNKILKKMNRKYTRENYLLIIKKLKEKIPEICVSTDIIIGFPGEAEKDVDDTIDIIEKVNFDAAFTFIYSKRVGTPAEKFYDNVDDKTKHLRFEKMLTVLNKKISEKNKDRKGNIYEVLVEGKSNVSDEFMFGRTDGNLLVTFKGDESLIGELVKVKIHKPKNFSLEGKIINTSI